MLCINQRKYIKRHHFGQAKEIILFIKQRLKITILVSHRYVNLVWDHIYNAPNAPSVSLFSQYTNHLKEREWIEWKKRG
jgi:hypothetical protein